MSIRSSTLYGPDMPQSFGADVDNSLRFEPFANELDPFDRPHFLHAGMDIEIEVAKRSCSSDSPDIMVSCLPD
jgi:hypothetical protein